MTRSFKKGYTLLELLIVLAILAVIATILTPVFARIGNRASLKERDGKNMQKLVSGLLQYVEDNDSKFPRAGYDCRGHNGSSPDDATGFAPGEHNQCGGDGWQDAIGPYVKETKVFLAPEDGSDVGEGPWGGGTGRNFNASDGNLSFLMNDLLAHKMPTSAGGYANPSKADPHSNGLRLSDVKRPADCLLLAEGHGGWDKASAPDDPGAVTARDWTGSTDLLNKWHHEYDLNGNFTPFLVAKGYDQSSFIRYGLPFRDNGGNMAFVDGHVKFITLSTPSGLPTLCHTLPWTKSIDPMQRNAGKDSCKDADNPLPANWGGSNWF